MLQVKPNSNDPFGILFSTQEVIQKANHVSLNLSQIDIISNLIQEKLRKGLDESDYGLGLAGKYEEDVQLVFIQDVVNFCFWSEKNAEKWSVEWPKGNIVSGGWYGLLAVFERAKAENVSILDAEFLSNLTLKKTKSIFRSASGTEIPLIQNRLNNLIEAGNVLSRKFDGKFINLIEQAKFDAIYIVKLIYDNFPSFRDETKYGEGKIYFLKRAQILANDLSYVTRNDKRLRIKNLDALTAFADYKIPQILRHFDVIKYSHDFSRKIDDYEIIPAFSPEETEIRSATIQGIDLIKRELKKYTASQIDNALWLQSQDQERIEKPYHRTYTIYY